MASTMPWILATLLALVSTVVRADAFATVAVPPQVPVEYRSLYGELEARLRAFDRRLGNPPKRDVVFATNLLTANSHAGPALLREDWWRSNLLYLDRLQALGVTGVTVTVSYPLLTPAFGDPGPYLSFYRKLAEEIRRRGMKLLVEHNVLLPGYTLVPIGPYYARLDLRRFAEERAAEAVRIVREVRPDYLSLVLEPQTHAISIGKRIGIEDWTRYVKAAVARLAKEAPGHSTLLGAGCGSWDDPDYVSRFARIKGLDYVDFHLYPLSNGYIDYMQRTLDWADEVRRIDPGKKIVISEAWLFKAGARELGGDPTDARMFARDVYGFWEPLDAHYMHVLGKMAHAKGFALVAPFWSRYFFSYLPYGDPTLQALEPHALMRRANQAAFAALLANRTTATGRAYAGIDREAGPGR